MVADATTFTISTIGLENGIRNKTQVTKFKGI
jgi:hypothetical protein